jgi:hypothetical protein
MYELENVDAASHSLSETLTVPIISRRTPVTARSVNCRDCGTTESFQHCVSVLARTQILHSSNGGAEYKKPAYICDCSANRVIELELVRNRNKCV